MFKPPKGTRDLDPKLAEKYNYVLDLIRSTFEKYGFRPLIVPAFEDFKLLSAKSGEAVKDEIYYFKDKSDRELGLRFEFTASLARFVSNNPDISKPFKAYQIGKVWRYDNPQKFRFREFWQSDIDIIGSDSITADLEVLACFSECMEKLGFKKYYIRVNSRKVLEKKLTSVGIKNIKDVFRIIDKMDKIGVDDVKKELKEKGFDADKIIKIIQKLKPEGEIKELLDLAKEIGLDKKLKFDGSLVRGLDYYTGLIFEVFAGEKISCGGGGRYDNLIKDIGGPDLPATGISFGVDRVVALMGDGNIDRKTRIFVAPVNDKVRIDAIKICKKIRDQNISCDTDLLNRKLSKQLEYASKLEIPYVAIVGPDELKKNSVKLRDMKTGKEKLVKIDKVKKEV